MITIPCLHGGPPHKFPDDWMLGGATGRDPRVDPRWQPTTYYYFDTRLKECWVTQVHLCDDAALDNFTFVERTLNLKSGDAHVRYVAAKRPGETKFSMLPWVYNFSLDTVYPFEEVLEDSSNTERSSQGMGA